MRAQRQATWQRWSLAAFQLAHSRYAGLTCHAARMLRRVGCIQKFTNLLRTFRISSLHPASGYLTPIGVDAGRFEGAATGRERDWEKPGYAAFASRVLCIPGYQRDSAKRGANLRDVEALPDH